MKVNTHTGVSSKVKLSEMTGEKLSIRSIDHVKGGYQGGGGQPAPPLGMMLHLSGGGLTPLELMVRC